MVAHVAAAFRLRVCLARGARLRLDGLLQARGAAAFVILGVDQTLLKILGGLLDDAAWLDALAKQKGLTQPYVTSSAKEEIGAETAVRFSSQATITEEALSKRYTEKAGS